MLLSAICREWDDVAFFYHVKFLSSKCSSCMSRSLIKSLKSTSVGENLFRWSFAHATDHLEVTYYHPRARDLILKYFCFSKKYLKWNEAARYDTDDWHMCRSTQWWKGLLWALLVVGWYVSLEQFIFLFSWNLLSRLRQAIWFVMNRVGGSLGTGAATVAELLCLGWALFTQWGLPFFLESFSSTLQYMPWCPYRAASA